MIQGFAPQTEPLTDYERDTLLPVICRGLSNKIGEASPLGKRKPLKVGRTCLQCVNYPCFDGIENLESDFANEGCHAFRKREEEK